MEHDGTRSIPKSGTPSVNGLVITIDNDMVSIAGTETNDLAELQVCNLDQFIADLKTAVLESDKPHAAMVRALILAADMNGWQADQATPKILEALKAEGMGVR